MAHRAAALAEWQFIDPFEPPNSTEPLLAHLRAFCFPGGEDAARQIRGVKITEKGEMRTSPQAQWIPFTAELTIDTTQSSFCWTVAPRCGKDSACYRYRRVRATPWQTDRQSRTAYDAEG